MVFPILMLPFMLAPLAIIAVLFFVFWLIMLVDAATRKFKDYDKVVWILVIIFTHIIGALIYYFIVYRKHDSLKWFWVTVLILILINLLMLVLFFLFFMPFKENVFAFAGN